MPRRKRLHLTGSAGLHIGNRPSQQDRLALMRHPCVEGVVLGVVADGVGGHSGGQLAAEEVVRHCCHWFGSFRPSGDVEQDFRDMAQSAHNSVRRLGVLTRLKPHSTIAAFLLLPDMRCHWIHSGDSRLYHFQDGKLVSRTRDHSLVQHMIDTHQLASEAARYHPQSNVLIGALGSNAEPPFEQFQIDRIERGGSIVACSDGVWHQFDSSEIGRAVHQMDSRAAVEWLIQTAMERAQGRSDNLSAIVVKADGLQMGDSSFDFSDVALGESMAGSML